MAEDNVSGADVAIDTLEDQKQTTGLDQITEEDKNLSDQPIKNPEDKQDNIDQTTDVKKKKSSGWHRKIARLERENAELKAKIAPQPTASALPDSEPKRFNYASDEEFIKAAARYEAKQEYLQNQMNDKKAAEAKAEEDHARNWMDKIDTLDDSYHDYDEVVGKYSNYSIHPEIKRAMGESDVGPQIAYYLAKNPDKLEEINSMTKVSAIYKEILRIESQISSRNSSSTSAAAVSKSPAPITPVKGRSTTSVSLEDMSTDDFIAYRQQQRRKSN